MSYEIDLQIACTKPLPINDNQILEWAEAALKPYRDKAELTIRFVDEAEMLDLNSTYRQQHKTTNVLAFPSHIPAEIALEYPLLGDVIICPAVIESESQAQHKPLDAHYAHIIIHGILHLLGYDHIDDNDAIMMQKEEIELLAKFNYANPYNEEDYHLE